jgi:NAD-dependent DNA ligase
MARSNSEQASTAVVLDVMEITDVLKGKTFSITGHLGLPRNQVIEIIEKAGGEFHKSPQWNTKYLVTNLDWNADSTIAPGTSRKLEAARAKGIKIINEKTLYKMISDAVEVQEIPE